MHGWLLGRGGGRRSGGDPARNSARMVRVCRLMNAHFRSATIGLQAARQPGCSNGLWQLNDGTCSGRACPPCLSDVPTRRASPPATQLSHLDHRQLLRPTTCDRWQPSDGTEDVFNADSVAAAFRSWQNGQLCLIKHAASARTYFLSSQWRPVPLFLVPRYAKNRSHFSKAECAQGK